MLLQTHVIIKVEVDEDTDCDAVKQTISEALKNSSMAEALGDALYEMHASKVAFVDWCVQVDELNSSNG